MYRVTVCTHVHYGVLGLWLKVDSSNSYLDTREVVESLLSDVSFLIWLFFSLLFLVWGQRDRGTDAVYHLVLKQSLNVVDLGLFNYTLERRRISIVGLHTLGVGQVPALEHAHEGTG